MAELYEQLPPDLNFRPMGSSPAVALYSLEVAADGCGVSWAIKQTNSGFGLPWTSIPAKPLLFMSVGVIKKRPANCLLKFMSNINNKPVFILIFMTLMADVIN